MLLNDRDYVIGIDIGGTYFRIGMVYGIGEIQNFAIESSSILVRDSSQLGKLTEYIGNYISAHGTGRLCGICIGFPSAVSREKKVVFQSPNICGFNDVNVADPLTEAFKVPVYVENDVNNLLLYEVTERCLEKSDITIGIYFGTGLGNAIYINGSILEGRHGVAGELGHIPVYGKYDLCGCGNNGCIESYASGRRLELLRKEYFPNTDIKEVFTRHKHTEVIQEFLKAMSIPISVEINIFDPDNIILGGGVVNMPGFPKEDLERKIFCHARKPFPAREMNIIYSNGSLENGVLGAAYNAYKKIGRFH